MFSTVSLVYVLDINTFESKSCIFTIGYLVNYHDIAQIYWFKNLSIKAEFLKVIRYKIFILISFNKILIF